MKDGRHAADIVALQDECIDGKRLIEPVMRAGRRLPQPTLEESRRRAAWELRALPDPIRSLDPTLPHPVLISEGLRRLAAELDEAHPGVPLK